MEGRENSKRYEEIKKLIPEGAESLTDDLLEEVIFLENKLDELRKLPFIKINPENPTQQRNTPAAKMYKEFLQQYINCIKLIENIIYREKSSEDEGEEESPLRRWFNNHAN